MWRTLRGISLTWWIVIATILGAIVGWFDHDVWLSANVGEALKPLSNIFLRMIKSIVVPLVFGALVIGIAGHGDDLKRVGRLALKSLFYFEIITTIALFIGLGAVNLIRPGAGVTLAAPAAEAQQFASTPTTLGGVLEHTVPQSFFEAASKNEVLQIVFFSVLFGAALTQVKGRPKESMIGFCEGLAEVMFKFTGIVMKFAP
ncbi:MAG: cation:dicarboxylase symporter family transporter, partial [Gemmatimonadota bacterium]